jgi:hypothetical protein
MISQTWCFCLWFISFKYIHMYYLCVGQLLRHPYVSENRTSPTCYVPGDFSDYLVWRCSIIKSQSPRTSPYFLPPVTSYMEYSINASTSMADSIPSRLKKTKHQALIKNHEQYEIPRYKWYWTSYIKNNEYKFVHPLALPNWDHEEVGVHCPVKKIYVKKKVKKTVTEGTIQRLTRWKRLK